MLTGDPQSAPPAKNEARTQTWLDILLDLVEQHRVLLAKLQTDLKEFIELLNSHGVESIIVGGHAVAFHA